MDIGNILFNITEIKSFIKSKFRNATFDRQELLLNSHSLCSSEFNLEFTEDIKSYTLFNLPVLDLYAYQETADDVCLYVLMDMDKVEFFSFVEHAGQPENVLPEDIVSGDFDFLAWHRPGMDITMMKDHFQRSETVGHFSVIITVTNIKQSTLLADLRDLF